MKMRIKKDLMLFFLPVIAVMCFVPVAPAFADMGKVGDAELAQINASVTGASVKKQINCVEKDGTCLETKQNSVITDKVVAISSQTIRSNTTEVTDLNLNIGGQTTMQFHLGGATSNTMGGITSVTPH
jgi:hypothetical protein